VIPFSSTLLQVKGRLSQTSGKPRSAESRLYYVTWSYAVSKSSTRGSLDSDWRAA